MLGKLYIITNNINGKVYIGKTYGSLEERFNIHIRDCMKKKNEKRPLYSAMLKYGINHFTIKELGEYEENFLEEKEIEYIKKYNSYVGFENSNGYNATLGGDGKRYFNHSEEEVISKYFELGYVSYVAQYFNCSVDTIAQILNKNNIDTSNSYNYRKKKIIMLYNSNSKEFDSIVEAANFLLQEGITKTTNIKYIVKGISRALNGNTKSYIGRIFKEI